MRVVQKNIDVCFGCNIPVKNNSYNFKCSFVRIELSWDSTGLIFYFLETKDLMSALFSVS